MDIETSVMEMWKKTYNTIKLENIVYSTTNAKINFVHLSKNEVFHVRPHERDVKDACALLISDKLTSTTEYTKNCF